MKKYEKLKEMFYYRGYNKQVIKLALLILFSLAYDVITYPFLQKQILDVQIPSGNIKGVIIFACIYVIALVVSNYIVLKYCIIRLDLRRLIENDLREDIFKKLQNVKKEFYDKNTTGTILQFLSKDSDNASNLFSRIIVEMVVMGIIRTLIISILLLFTNFKIGIGIIVIYISGLLTTIILNKKTIEPIKEVRKANIEIFNIMNEGISGFNTVKLQSIEEEQILKLEKGIAEYEVAQNNINKITAKYNTLFEMIYSFSLVWLLINGTLSLTSGLITYGILTIIINWIGDIKSESRFILNHLTDFNQSYVAFYKILKFLESEKEEDLEEGEHLNKIKEIEFKDVNFSYKDGKRVISNFNLKVKEKEQVAFVGKTGSGKSTIVNMVCRFYDADKGKILINGKNIKDYNLKELRSKIGYVMQDVLILKYTIIDNMKYVNPNITLEEIQDIFKKLNLHDKIMTLKDKYETNIYDNPDILSKGEKQLISFARIMAMNPEIIILDEVTSSLSYSSEMLLRNAVSQITKDKICFIIAHRLSTVSKCDNIIVMKNGKILESGKHTELLERKGEYYNMVNRIAT